MRGSAVMGLILWGCIEATHIQRGIIAGKLNGVIPAVTPVRNFSNIFKIFMMKEFIKMQQHEEAL